MSTLEYLVEQKEFEASIKDPRDCDGYPLRVGQFIQLKDDPNTIAQIASFPKELNYFGAAPGDMILKDSPYGVRVSNNYARWRVMPFEVLTYSQRVSEQEVKNNPLCKYATAYDPETLEETKDPYLVGIAQATQGAIDMIMECTNLGVYCADYPETVAEALLILVEEIEGK